MSLSHTSPQHGHTAGTNTKEVHALFILEIVLFILFFDLLLIKLQLRWEKNKTAKM